MLTNILHIIIAPYQVAKFSEVTRTATFIDGSYVEKSLPGAYKFTSFILMDHAQVQFAPSDAELALTHLELHYGSVLYAWKLVCVSNNIILHPGSTMDLTGGGFIHETGPGAGAAIAEGATGAGYAAAGGSPYPHIHGGAVYGLTRNPEWFGSGGGGEHGGAGGGLLQLKVFLKIQLDGKLISH